MKLAAILTLLLFGAVCARDELSCAFELIGGVYACTLTASNGEGRDDWPSVGGAHLDGFTDADVRLLRATNQLTANVPAILCRTFAALAEISLVSSQVGDITAAAAFADCGALERLSLARNLIERLPDNAFISSGSLRALDLADNRLTQLGANAFAGLGALKVLSLLGNSLTTLRPEWFAPLTALEELRLELNDIRELPSGVFATNLQLAVLGLTFNQLTEIDAASFGDLGSLRTIHADFNHINAIDRRLYDSAGNLDGLILLNNVCTQSSFTNIASSRAAVRSELETCFDNFDTETTLECFFLAAEHFPYTCELTIVNPQGRDDFESIGGEHVAENGDADVLRVEAFNQHSLNLPSILCDTFTSLEELTLMGSRVEVLTARTFENCGRLSYLALEHNNISALVDGVFAGSPRLALLNLNDNRIASIAATAFAGTSLWFVDLEHNALSFLNPAWFDAVNATLASLNLNGNFLSYLPPRAFAALASLEQLEIGDNPFEVIPSDAFDGLARLQFLALFRCRISELKASWFAGLHDLRSLHLDENEIAELPAGIFAPLRSLDDVNVSQNRLTTVDSNAFGDLAQLRSFNAITNHIDAIDAAFFDSAELLYILFLYGNECVSGNFINVLGNRDSVRNELLGCFDNFVRQERGVIACEYVDFGEFGYFCEMTIENPRGGDDFERVDGEHLEGFTDADVYRVEAYEQRTAIVPSVICSQFSNLRVLSLAASSISTVTPTAFAACGSLEQLILDLNDIPQMPANLLANSPLLAVLSLSGNQLTAVPSAALANTHLRRLAVDGNRLTLVESAWFDAVRDSLQELTLAENDIAELPTAAFGALPNLTVLDLSANAFASISADAFDGLPRLELLQLTAANIADVQPQWFAHMPALMSVFLNLNRIGELPAALFARNPRLFELDVNGNRLRVLSSDVFADLAPLEHLSAGNNRLRAIDARIFDDAAALYTLFLFENVCVDENFVSVPRNRSEVRAQLSGCFEAFEREGVLECTFREDELIPYRCELDIGNAAGRDDFERIAGEHVGARSDADVLRLESLGQVTVNFPRVICRQFANLEEVFFARATIEALTADSFADCRHLSYLNLEQNLIETLGDGVLSALTSLRTLSFYENRLSLIEEHAFRGLPLDFLSLERNALSYVNAGWFDGSPLTYLTMARNRLVSLPSAGFSSLQSLGTLVLAGNSFVSLPIDAFEGLRNLTFLNLNECSLGAINPRWFTGLLALERLYLQTNGLASLPPAAFNNLTHVNVADNNLRFVGRNSFENIERLTQFSAQRNQINAIEAAFFDDASALYALQLVDNVCVSSNFVSIPANRVNVRQQLLGCFANFEATEIGCEFQNGFDPYTCALTLVNPTGRDDFEEIPGVHYPGRGDEDVLSVDGAGQQSSVFPAVICRQFANLQFVFLVDSEIEVLTRETFAECANLWSLTLDGNRISEVGDNFFANSPSLGLLSLALNRVARVAADSLAGTNLILLELEGNAIEEIPSGFFGHSPDLVYLFLNGNRLRSLPARVFDGLAGLRSLDLSGNRELSAMPSDVFSGLRELSTLSMGNCNFSAFEPLWFAHTGALTDLYVGGNPVSQLPAGLFDNLTRLAYLVVDSMQLERLDSRSFGRAQQSLAVIRARGNRIDAIDPLLLDRSVGVLAQLYLINNVCVDMNFSDVGGNFEEVQQELARCFVHFEEGEK